ncbi:hypothetical protein EV368DRAFT_67203 [Lentinula lateritia]|nr:hypothetical protein EV368DRAFT_67203 [Lentinula lateritia]
MDKGITLFRNILTFAFLLSLFLHRVEGETLGQTWKAGASITPIARCQEDIGYLLPRDSSNLLYCGPTTIVPDHVNEECTVFYADVVVYDYFADVNFYGFYGAFVLHDFFGNFIIFPEYEHIFIYHSSQFHFKFIIGLSNSTIVYFPSFHLYKPPTIFDSIHDCHKLNHDSEHFSLVTQHLGTFHSIYNRYELNRNSQSYVIIIIFQSLTVRHNLKPKLDFIPGILDDFPIFERWNNGPQSMSMSDTSSSGTVSSSQTFSTTSSPVITGSFSATSMGRAQERVKICLLQFNLKPDFFSTYIELFRWLIKTSNEEKRWHQNQNEVPSSSEKRSVYAIAASVVGRVGVPNNLSHNNNLNALFSDDEKEGLNNNFERGRRTRGGSISTLAASVAKRTHLPLDMQNHRSGSDNRELEHTLPPSSSSTPMSHSPPPSSLSPSRNHTPFPSFPFTFYRASSSSSRNGSISPVQDVPATASVTDTDVSDQISYLEPVSHNRLIHVLDTEVQIPNQRGYIPIVRTDTRDTTGSSTYSASGMEYIPFMRRDTETDSYIQTAPMTPSTRSLNLTRTHTSQSAKSDVVDSQPSPPCENASGIFRASQDSLHSRDTHDSRNTRNTYATQSTVDTTSSLMFAQPNVIRMSASHGNETTLKDETREIPLITSTFHYSPDPEDESDIAVGPRPSSNGVSAPSSSSKNPFNPSHPLFQSGPPNFADQGNSEGDSFFRTLEWRRRALAYADGTGQRPSLMEAVEVYFSDRKE